MNSGSDVNFRISGTQIVLTKALRFKTQITGKTKVSGIIWYCFRIFGTLASDHFQYDAVNVLFLLDFTIIHN